MTFKYEFPFIFDMKNKRKYIFFLKKKKEKIKKNEELQPYTNETSLFIDGGISFCT